MISKSGKKVKLQFLYDRTLLYFTPIYKSQKSKLSSTKSFLQEFKKVQWSLNLEFLLYKGLKLTRREKLVFGLDDGSLQTILICILEDLAGGGSMAVAVGVSHI